MGVMSWLAGKFTRTEVLHSVELVAAPALYYQHSRIGGGLTPEDVSGILRECDNGYLYRFCDLANESRQKDCHLQSILGTREMAVAGLRALITPASNSAKDKIVADWCAEWIANFGTSIPEPGEDEPHDMRRAVSHLMGGNYFGHATNETLFGKDGKYVVPIGAVPIAPRRFCFNLADGHLRFWDVQGKVPYPGTDLQEAFPGRFVTYLPRINGDVVSREGLGRLLVWAAMFRNWDIGDWLKLAEIAWKPWRIATYSTKQGPGLRDASKEDIAAALKAATQLTTSGVAVLPDTVDMAVEWAKRGSGNAQHAELAGFFAAEMSKAVLGATLTVEQGRVGSNALGNVHNEVRHDIRDADAMAIAACIRRFMIAPAVILNFGKGTPIPGFALVADEMIDVGKFSVAVKNFADAGVAMGADYVRGRAQIPKPKAGEELVGGGTYGATAPTPPAPPKKPQGKPAQGEDDDAEEAA